MVVRSVVFTRYWFNPKLLNPVDTSNTTVGISDFVLVIDSYEKVKALQDKEHGGWVENMRKVYILFNCFNEIALLGVALLSIHVTVVKWLHSYPMYGKGKPTRSAYLLNIFSIYVFGVLGVALTGKPHGNIILLLQLTMFNTRMHARMHACMHACTVPCRERGEIINQEGESGIAYHIL